MFRPVPMVRLQVQVPNRDGPAVTNRIAAHGLLHLIDIGRGLVPPAGGAGSRELLARFRAVARRVSELAAAVDVPPAAMAGALPTPAIADLAVECDAIEHEFEPLRQRFDAALRRLAAAREANARAHTALDRARRLDAAGIDPARLRPLRFACVRIGSASAEACDQIAALLAPAAFAVITLATGPAQPVAAVAVPASGRDQLDAALRLTPFEPLAADEEERPEALGQRVEATTIAERAAEEELATVTREAGDTLSALARRAEVGVLLVQAQTFFAASGRFLVISGWIPEDRAPELAAAIARVTENRAVVSVDKPEAMRASSAVLSVPVLYRNPLLLRPFQRLVDIYGLPSYTEVQPTAFFAISFLTMFGLMFGDVGHGAVLAAAGYCLFRYMPAFLDYGILLIEAGTMSILFGVAYGSVFGVEDLLPALWIHPIRDLAHFMRVAIALGVVMVSAGFVLGVVNAWRAGQRATAVAGTRGLAGAFAYWACIAIAVRLFMPVTWTVPDALVLTLVICAVGVLAARPAIVRLIEPEDASALGARERAAAPLWLAALEASVDLVDTMIGYFANTVSFVRIAAFAAVHAGVFVAVFALADTLARYRFGGWLSIPVLVGGNVVMILLEGLTVTVQVLRLEYYEFFGKFFRGGGQPYRPLKLQSKSAQGE